MADLFSVAETVVAVIATVRGADVYERFQNEPDTLAIAVLDEDDRPVGIVERNSFFVRMAAEYGRALYAMRPISTLMNPQPVVVEGSADLAGFCREVLRDQPSELLHGFIIVREGRYAGVGSALSLLQAVSRANRAHADEMTHLAATLDEARLQAQASLKAKSDFLAVMSHEIRTPLNGVLGIAEILAIKMPNDELRPYVDTIIESGKTLLRLLTDALDLSRGGAGKLALDEAPFRPAAMMDDLMALWSPRAVDNGLALSVRFEGDDEWVLGDSVRLKQVFNNLIGNAIKFTAEGRVDAVLTARRDDIYVLLEASVADTGPGAPDDKLGAIFEPFVQDVAGRVHGGAGLGLAICRELVELMDGSICAKINGDGGLTFAFDVILFQVCAAPAAAAQPPPSFDFGRPLKILVADDNASNRLLAETLCGIMGCEVVSVDDGAQAVAAVQAQLFDLVLMDIKMPVLDGLGATARIRRLPGAAGAVPIIALTANANPWDAVFYQDQGMNAVVEKPIKPEALFTAVRRVLGNPPAQAVAA